MSHAIRKILVAIKDPYISESVAARKAAQLAGALHAELYLYHALTSPLYVDAGSLATEPAGRAAEAARAAVNAQLERLAMPLRAGALKVTTETDWDYPSHEAVVRAALRLDSDLVVVDCPRQAHTAAWLFHFTDWELLRNSPLPLLIVKNSASYARAPVLAALDPEHTSGKPASLDADILAYGSALAVGLGVHLHAVHAFNPLPSLSANQLLIPQLLAELEQQAYSQAQQALSPALDQIGMEQGQRHLEEGFAIDVIESVLRRTGAQILVVGSISRTGIKGLMIGNTAERMLDRVACDMLIVRPPDFVSTVSHAPRALQILPRDMLVAAVCAAN
jgi:universal stress protein E